MKPVPPVVLYVACIASFVMGSMVNQMRDIGLKWRTVEGCTTNQNKENVTQDIIHNQPALAHDQKSVAASSLIRLSKSKVLENTTTSEIGEKKPKTFHAKKGGPNNTGTSTSTSNNINHHDNYNNSNHNRAWKKIDKTGTSTTSAGAKGDHDQSTCQNKLDDLEKIWNKRRDARRHITATKTNKPDNPKKVFDFFEPEAVCLDDERFGAKHYGRYKAFGDGPKFVCGVDQIIEKAATNKDCLIYSVGSNNQIDFEAAVSRTMGKGNCEIHTFDPTVPPDTYIGKRYSTFHDWGFGKDGVKTTLRHKSRGTFKFTQMSVKSAMKRLGHDRNRTIDIFKIDCEGCEFEVLTAAFNAVADGEIKINQVQVEIHSRGSLGAYGHIKTMFEAADRANMRVFHKERNGWGCDGYRCLEYAFVSNDFLRKAHAHYLC